MERRIFLTRLGTGLTTAGTASLAGSASAKSPATGAARKTEPGLATHILIRPAARGGKYLGHDAANAQNLSALVALQDLATSKIVAHSFAVAPTAQSAGPENLMDPVSRSKPFASDADSVQVRLKVSIAGPTDFRVLMFGPLKHQDQARLVQADITVLPGVDIGTTPQNPEGLVLEIPGLCISGVSAHWQGTTVTCTAMVTMMCGCPIHDQPGWFWPDTDFSIQLVTYMQSGATHFYPLAYDKKPGLVSTFTGAWPSQAARNDRVKQVWVYAFEPKLGNQGKFKVFPALPATPRLPTELREILSRTGVSHSAKT